MLARIVVGTDGSETAEGAVGQAIELAKLTGAELDIVSAYEPISQERLRGESAEIPGDIQHTVNPREDVNMILANAEGEAKKEGVEVQTHPRGATPRTRSSMSRRRSRRISSWSGTRE